MSNSEKGRAPRIHINKAVFIPAFLALVLFSAAGIFKTEAMEHFLTIALYSMSDSVGWFYELLTLIITILTLVLAFSKYGRIRIGGADAKPDFKLWNWATMTICGGLGTGLLFWAMGEPIYHFMQPPTAAGAAAMSREAAIFAVSQDMWIWSFPQFTLYSICGLAFALAGYNFKKPLSYLPVIELAIGRNKKSAVLSSVVHSVTVFTMCAAVACSMGVGLLQIGAGLENLLGIPQSNIVYLGVAVVITVMFTLSSVSGLGNGMKKLASFTAVIFLLIMCYVILLGPKEFVAKLGMESLGELLTKWPQKTLILNTMAPKDKWFADWPIQYIGSYIVYAPTLGMFLARLSKGRTIKEFILVNVIARSVFVIIWIGVFGSLEVYFQATGSFDVWAVVNQYGIQATIFLILDQFPLGGILITLFLIAIFAAFSTIADPVASALATLSTKGLESIDEEAPTVLKIMIGIMMGVVAFMLVLSGGVNAVKGMWLIIGLPVSFLMILMVVALFRGMNKLSKKADYLETDVVEAGSVQKGTAQKDVTQTKAAWDESGR